MKIITISGLDGSGKSTQIEMLKTYLEKKGKRVFYFHAIRFGIANKIASFFSGHSERSEESQDSSATPQNDNVEKSVTQANWLQILLRKLFLRIDIYRFKKLVSELEKDGYDYIASDRYFYDSVVNIQYLSLSCHPEFISGSDFKPQEMLKQVQHDNYNIVKPDIAIYLQTDPDIIMQRERKPDQGIEYLQKKKELYDTAAPIFGLTIINGNRNKEEIFEEIKKGF